MASRMIFRVVASGAGSAIVVTVTGGASACFDCFDLCWLVELMHDLGKLLRWPNINRHNSLMSSDAVCVDVRDLSLKSQVERVFGMFLVSSVVSASSLISLQYFSFAHSKMTFRTCNSSSMSKCVCTGIRRRTLEF